MKRLLFNRIFLLRQSRRYIVAIAVWFVLLTISSPGLAAKTPAVVSPSEALSESMIVTPTKVEEIIRPGQESSVSVEITNDSSQELKITFSAWDFARDNKGGIYRISEKDASRFRGAAKWLSYPARPITLKAREKRKVNINIKAPTDSSPGSHATYLRVLGTPPKDSSGNITVRYAINALFLPIVLEKTHGRIPTLKTTIRLKKFSSNGYFHTILPFNLTAMVRNEGNIHQNFDGKIEVWQGKVKLSSMPLKQTLLPEQNASMVAPVKEIPYFGKFRAKFIGVAFLAKSYKKQAITGQITFWYVPRTLLYSVAGVIFFIISLGIWLLRKFLRARRAQKKDIPKPDQDL